MKKQYLIPSSLLLDSSKLHLFRNQATCDLNILNGEQLDNNPTLGSCGNADAASDTVEICLSDSVNDVSQFEGLILRGFLGEEITIDSCVDVGSGTGGNCPGTAYVCTDIDGSISDDRCIVSIHCADGTELTDCDSQNCLVVTDGLTNGL
jgi:hypothetical protein